MKKIILPIVMLFMFFSTALAQINTEHLSFKGVPIDGRLVDYVAKMKKSGFEDLGTENGVAMLKGDFAGFKDCLVGVSILSQQDLVYKIGVLFQDTDDWSTLSGNYFNLKEMLTEKYGKPTDYEEKFDAYSQPNDDGTKMMYVKLDKCKYFSSWETEKGSIQLSIRYQSPNNCFVRLAYFDKINGSIIRDKAKDDL